MDFQWSFINYNTYMYRLYYILCVRLCQSSNYTTDNSALGSTYASWFVYNFQNYIAHVVYFSKRLTINIFHVYNSHQFYITLSHKIVMCVIIKQNFMSHVYQRIYSYNTM